MFSRILVFATAFVCWVSSSFGELGLEVGLSVERVDAALGEDAGIVAYLAPYREGVEAFALEVIGVAAEPLSRSRPECGLSNLVADSLRVVGAKEFDEEIDLAFSNFGGLRRNLPQGPLTMGLISELSPFENYLTYVEVKGDFVLKLASYAKGGVAISGMEIVLDSDGELVSAMVAGEPVDPARHYKVMTIDYLASTWDELFVNEWVLEKRVSGNLVQRDAIVLHLSELNAAGVEIYDAGENRVRIREDG